MMWQPEYPFNEATASIEMPDDDTREMVIYGSAYMQVKLQLRTIDRIINVLETKITDIMAKLDLATLEKVQSIPEYNDVVYKGVSVPLNVSVNELQTIDSMHAIARHVHAIAVLKNRKDRIIEVGRMIGAVEHSARISARGPTQSEWQMSAMNFNVNPIDDEGDAE